MKQDEKMTVTAVTDYHNRYEIVYKYSDSGFMHNKLQNYIDTMVEKIMCT